MFPCRRFTGQARTKIRLVESSTIESAVYEGGLGAQLIEAVAQLLVFDLAFHHGCA